MRPYAALFVLSFLVLALSSPSGATAVQSCTGLLTWTFSPPLAATSGTGNMTMEGSVTCPHAAHNNCSVGNFCAGTPTYSVAPRIPYEGNCVEATGQATGLWDGYSFRVLGGAAFTAEYTRPSARVVGTGTIAPTSGDRCALAAGVGPATFAFAIP